MTKLKASFFRRWDLTSRIYGCLFVLLIVGLSFLAYVPVLPNLVGMTGGDAASLLVERGLILAFQTEVTRAVPAHTILWQSATPGRILRGSVVTVTVAQDPRVSMPALAEATQEAAGKMLHGVGLKMAVLTYVYSNTVKKGRVISQSVAPEALVEPSSSVSLQLSSGARPAPRPVLSQSSVPYIYVGSKRSNIFHVPPCKWANKISARNKIGFSSISDAQKHGYRACKVCQPTAGDGWYEDQLDYQGQMNVPSYGDLLTDGYTP